MYIVAAVRFEELLEHRNSVNRNNYISFSVHSIRGGGNVYIIRFKIIRTIF